MTSQAVTPPDEKLEKLMDEYQSWVITVDSWTRAKVPTYRVAALIELEGARAALREYVFEDTRRLDWLEEFSDGFYNLDRISAVPKMRQGPFNGLHSLRKAIDAARRASIKEHPEK